MSGWIATAFVILTFLACAVVLARRAAKRWWDYLIVLALAGLLIVPFYSLTGDVSTVLPNVWSDGADGKDQIILASVAATFLWPLIAAALIVWAVGAVAQRVKSRNAAQ